MKRLLILSLLLGTSFATQAQYAADALRFSQTNAGTTSRFAAIGNAQTGIGGDLSSLGGNPAGLGLFTKSDASLSFEFNNYASTANYLNKTTLGSLDRLNIQQAGLVVHIPAYRPKGSDLESGWIGFSVGLGYNRHADFGNQFNYSGTNPNNSIADFFAESANANYGDPSTLAGTGSLEEMAYNNYLIDYNSGTSEYVYNTDINNLQSKQEERRGGQTQVNMSFAGNYSNRFYFGLNLGFASLKYESNADFMESGLNVNHGNSAYTLHFLQDQSTTGKGFNAKFGFIYKLLPSVRVGASYESPTWYEIDDSYTEVLNTKHADPLLNFANTPENYSFMYKLRTPSKLSAGLGLFFGTFGFISADVDVVDYSKIKFRGMSSQDLSTIASNNDDVFATYQKTTNYRFGAEFKVNQLAFRGGYGIQGNPYKTQNDANRKTKTMSGGIGYRVKNYYTDFTYQRVSFSNELQPYTLANNSQPKSSVKSVKTNLFLTFGIRF